MRKTGTFNVKFQDDWRVTKLGEYLASKSKSIIPGKSPKKIFELYSVPSLETGAPEILEGSQIGSNKQIVGKGTVLLCKINPRINRTWVVTNYSPYPKIASTEWITFPPHEDFEPKYLSYFLKQDKLRDFLAANASGVGGSLMRVKPATVANFLFPLAPKKQQQIIVAEIEKQFSRLDEAVAGLKRAKANLKRYKAAILMAAVEGRLTEQWRKEHTEVEPAEKLLQRILAERRAKWEKAEMAKMKAKGQEPKDNKWKQKYKEPDAPVMQDLLPIPDTWAWATLPQLGELNRGKSKNRPRNDPKLYGGPFPFVQTGDIRQANGVIQAFSQTYSEEGLKQSRLWPKGTLCITIAANIADTAILGIEACFPDSVVGFIPHTGDVDARFVEFFLRTAKQELERYAPATAQKNINIEILNDFPIPLPPLSEQKLIIAEVERRLSIADMTEEVATVNLHRSERLRQSILKKAFSGQLLRNGVHSTS